MNLQRQHARLRRLGRLLIRHVRREPPVDEMLEMIPRRDDHVVVPVIRFDVGLNGLRVPDRAGHFHLRLARHFFNHRPLTALRENAPCPFLIQNARVSLAPLEVRLIPAHDGAKFSLLHHLAPVLDARIALRRNLVRKAQLEVARLLVRINQKRVVADLVVRVRARLPGDQAVLDGPQFRVALPARQVAAVAERLKARLLSDRRDGDQSQRTGEKNRFHRIQFLFG